MQTLTTKFDWHFAKQYNPLFQEKQRIIQRINYLIDIDAVGNTEMNNLCDKFAQNQQQILNLLNKNTRYYFVKYSQKIFDVLVDVITSDATLRKCTTNWWNFATYNDKIYIGQLLLNKITTKFEIDTLKFELKTIKPEGIYHPTTKTITINKNYSPTDFLNFIGILMHEFTHHIYHYYPQLSPLGEQKTYAIMQNLDSHDYKQPTKIYKQHPMEKPAYFVDNYLQKHELIKYISSQIHTL